MEETGRRRLAAAGIAAASIAYFFAFATPLPAELALVPAWASPLAGSPSAPSSGAAGDPAKASSGLHAFRLGASYGYFSEEGRILFAAPRGAGVALSDSAFAPYERVQDKAILRSPAGTPLASIAAPGYPFMKAGRIFLMNPGQTGVSGIDPSGGVAWSREFATVVTAFDASPSLALFGLLDGSLVGLGPGGEELISFAPGGSRIAGVFGCAVSPDGRYAAAVTGLDGQRLVVLERRASAYRVTWHVELGSGYRRPVEMAFTADGRYLLHERPEGAGVWAAGAREETLLPGFALGNLGDSVPGKGFLLCFEGGAYPRLVLALPSGKRVATVPIAAGERFMATHGQALFLGLGDPGGAGAALVRLDIEEE